jgi:hypothetical protein
MGKSKTSFTVVLDNGKKVGVQIMKIAGDRYFSVFGGHAYESIDSIKKCSSLNAKTPNVPEYITKLEEDLHYFPNGYVELKI